MTNLLEINRIKTKSSSEVAEALNNWLARYPRPRKCVHDNGPEFVGQEIQSLLQQALIKSRPSTSRNPQGNSIIEAVHKTVGSVIRTLHLQMPIFHYHKGPRLFSASIQYVLPLLTYDFGHGFTQEETQFESQIAH